MGEMYNRIFALCQERGLTVAKMCKDAGISKSAMTELKMGRTQQLSSKALQKVAEYFNVSSDLLLGHEKENPTANGDEALMFALWEGDTKDVTPEMLNKVREFARFVREEERRKANDPNKSV